MATFKKKAPSEKRAPNTMENGDIAERIEKFKHRDRKKVSVRIDNKTYVLVDKNKKTKDYAEKYQARLKESRKGMEK